MITPPSDNNDSEVVIMSDDLFWQVFTDTDPLCWLMHRAAEKSNNKDGAGDGPRPLG